MVEAGAREVSEAQILDAIDLAHAGDQEDRRALSERLAAQVGKPKPAWTAPAEPYPPDFAAGIQARFAGPLDGALHVRGKLAQLRGDRQGRGRRPSPRCPRTRAPRSEPLGQDRSSTTWSRSSSVAPCSTRASASTAAPSIEIRQITCEVGVLPRTHGSALFTRGETQALVTVHARHLRGRADHRGARGRERSSASCSTTTSRRSPSGEVKFLRGPGRREIGHGKLARRALTPVIPEKDAFPYTLRVVSDILESNGSSSMATVCGGTLALMDAGVPITAPVAGVAMGLVSDGDALRRAHRHRRAGGPLRRHGLQGRRHARGRSPPCRWTSRSAGLPRAIMERGAGAGATRASAPPRQHGSHDRGAAAGHLGLRAAHHHDHDQPGQDPRRHRTRRQDHPRHQERDRRQDQHRGRRHASRSPPPTRPRPTAPCRSSRGSRGSRRSARSSRAPSSAIEPYGAFVEILPNRDGLLHISELAHERTREVTDVIKLGDKIKVKIIGIDGNDRIKLSHRALMPPPEGFNAEATEGASDRPRRPHSDRPGGRGRDRDRGPRREGRH